MQAAARSAGVRLLSRGTSAEQRLPALVLVHGGPGAYQVAHFTEHRDWYDRLASLGLDVYLYDQVGSGLSPRLADPRRYTVARHVADLEAIRVAIGAERMILLGDSWGATLSLCQKRQEANEEGWQECRSTDHEPKVTSK